MLSVMDVSRDRYFDCFGMELIARSTLALSTSTVADDGGPASPVVYFCGHLDSGLLLDNVRKWCKISQRPLRWHFMTLEAQIIIQQVVGGCASNCESLMVRGSPTCVLVQKFI